MNAPLDIQQGNLPLNFTGNPTEFFKTYKARLVAKIPGNQVLIGFVGAGDPRYNAGPWLEIPASGPWVLHYWDQASGKYLPAAYQVGTGTYKTTLGIGSSAGPNDPTPGFFLPDKSGTAADQLDLYVPRETKVITSTAVTININGNLNDSFIHRLTRNTNYVFQLGSTVTILEGQTLHFTIQNNGTAYTLAWFNVLWPAGASPVQPVATAGQTATGKYSVTRINDLLYGEFEATYLSSPTSIVEVGGPNNNLNYHFTGHVGPGQGYTLLEP